MIEPAAALGPIGLRGILVAYVALLALAGVPAILYSRHALRHVRNMSCCFGRKDLVGRTVVDREGDGHRLAAIVALDIKYYHARDLIHMATGERLFPSDARQLLDRLRKEADRHGVPLFIGEREAWNVVCAPANDLARRYLSGRMNLSRIAFMRMIESAYAERGIAYPSSEAAVARAGDAATLN